MPADEGAELKHVVAALDDAHRYLDGSVVDYFRLQLGQSKTDDGTFGTARALPLRAGHTRRDLTTRPRS